MTTITNNLQYESLSGSMVLVDSSIPTSLKAINELPFRTLAEQWTRETSGFPRVKDRIKHPAYLKIINLGECVIPYILTELKNDEPDHWFEALYQITHNDPIPPEDRGNVRKMADAWIRWGRQRQWTS